MERKITFGWAIVPLLVMIGIMLVTIVYLKQGPHIPLLVGTVAAGNTYNASNNQVAFRFDSAMQGISIAWPACRPANRR